MQVSQPRRLVAVLALLAGIAVAAAYLLTRPSGGPAVTPTAAVHAPTLLVPVIAASDKVSYAYITTTAAHGTTGHLIDRADNETADYDNGKLTSFQVGKMLYQPTASGCDEHIPSSSGPVGVLVAAVLPYNTSATYTSPRAGEIDWKVASTPAAAKTAPHGQITVDPQTHLITGGVSYNIAPYVQRFQISYNAAAHPAPTVPAKLCTEPGLNQSTHITHSAPAKSPTQRR